MNKRRISLWLSATCVVFAMMRGATGPAGARPTAQARGHAPLAAPAMDTLYAWGDNFGGQLGDGTLTLDLHTEEYVVPVGRIRAIRSAARSPCECGTSQAGTMGPSINNGSNFPTRYLRRGKRILATLFFD